MTNSKIVLSKIARFHLAKPFRIDTALLLTTLLLMVAGATTAASAQAVSGTGTQNYIPLWSSSSTLGNSMLFQSTTGDVGVGTSLPAATLDVNGTVNAVTGYNIGGTPFAFGDSSVTTRNAFLGFAGNSTMTRSYNTATGYQALFSNTTGSGNTASGVNALYGNTIGSNNTASGMQALYHNRGGNNNTASGVNALFYNMFGSYNTADGRGALYLNSGSYNTASGYRSLYQNTAGNYNVALGYLAGQTADASAGTGSGNTAVGAGTAFGTGSLINATAIGSNAVVNQSNALVLGCIASVNDCAGTVTVGIGTASPTNLLTLVRGGGVALADGWTTYSSRRWKTNIQTLQGALGKVEQLRGVSFDLKANGKHEVGVIAEEVGAVVPEVVSYEANGKDASGVDYGRLTALLIEATKEKQREIRQQEAVLRTQAAAIRSLKSDLRATRQILQKVQAQVAAAQPALVAAK